MAIEYDVSKAFKRVENELIDSMVRNLKRHQVEETLEGLNWEQWQALQLKELEAYRLANPEKFAGDFHDINKKVEDAFRNTYQDASTKEEARILDMIRKGKITDTAEGAIEGSFFGLNASRLEHMVNATNADFARGEWSMLRQANDKYRQIIFDAQVYSATGATYAQAVDMATKDFLRAGIQNITYKNGARHTMQDYAEMAVRTGQKRAYLMGEGDAHDKYGIHTVRVNKRENACPLCVKWLGKVLVDDVYSGGTAEEARKANVPLLSEAIDEGFLHPNCKDVYTMYVEGISKPADAWTKEELEEIAGRYNQEQAIKRAEDMSNTYDRMARCSLDPINKERYQARADAWTNRLVELQDGQPPTPITVAPPAPPAPPPAPPKVETITPFTDDELEALEWYVSGDGMWINQYMRGRGSKELLETPLSAQEVELRDLLKSATNRPLESDIHTLYRSVDAEAVLGELSPQQKEILQRLYSDDPKVQQDILSLFDEAKGKTVTDKGFMSTTMDKDLAVNWDDFTGADNPIVLELNTEGKAVRGAKIPKELEIPEDPQHEVLLANNTKYKVKEVTLETAEDGTRYINVKADIVDDVAETVAETAVETETVAQSEAVAEAVKTTQHEVVEGKDLVGQWKRRKDDFDFAIDDIIEAQGFNGKPQIVSAEEFDKAVKESNFIAQRTYSAPTKEILDDYAEQLYNGKWYVDCSTGGAQYGQGMYCASDYTGTLTEGIKSEMRHYQEINKVFDEAGNSVNAYDAKKALQDKMFKDKYGHAYDKNNVDDVKKMRTVGRDATEYMSRPDVTWEKMIDDFDLPYKMGTSRTETMTLTPDAKIFEIPKNVDVEEYVSEKLLQGYVEKRLVNVDDEVLALWERYKEVQNELSIVGKHSIEQIEKLYDELNEIRNSKQWFVVQDIIEQEVQATVYSGATDIGVQCAQAGYDAINAVGHGESGSYTVILNRTKVIFKEQ